MTSQGSGHRHAAVLIAALLLATGFLAGAAALAADEPQPGKDREPRRPIALVEATGEAVVNETPDVAIASVGVTTEAPTAAEAMDKNAQIAARVVKALRDLGLSAADAIRTQAIGVGPVYEEKPGPRPRIVGYRASNQVQIRVTTIALLGPALDAALKAGATDIGGQQFVLGNPQQAELRALEAAVKVARERAETMARTLGRPMGRIVKVQTLDEPGVPRREPMALSRVAAAPIPVEPGVIGVRARVLIRAELQ